MTQAAAQLVPQIADNTANLVNYGALGIMCLFFMAISFKALAMLGQFLQRLLTEFLTMTHQDNEKLRVSLNKDNADLNDTVRRLVHQIVGLRIAFLAEKHEQGTQNPGSVSARMMAFTEAELAKAHGADGRRP